MIKELLGISGKALTGWVVGLVILVIALSTFGINDNGYRTVVQWPNGTTFVKFQPGMYWTLFGSTTKYPDEMTFDYDDASQHVGTMSESGINVRYQDGGTGTTYGKLRIKLPTDEKTMLELHRSVRSAQGFANRIIRPTVKEAHQMTAGLMSSEAAYAEKRGTYIEWVDAQLRKGKFVTKLVEHEMTDEAGEIVKRMIPTIKRDAKTNEPLHTESVFKSYGVTIGSSPITNWDFEDKTLQQISAKREATMAIITAKANAERAKQDAITAEQQGLANVMQAKYEKEVEKEKAVVDAEKAKEVAVIEAEKLVDVAEQKKLERIQLKLAAMQYEKQKKAEGRGDASYKRMVFEADGALQQKLDAWVEVNQRYAEMIPQYKGDWVSRVSMGSNGKASGNGAQDMIDLLTIKTAKDLSLDVDMNNK